MIDIARCTPGIDQAELHIPMIPRRRCDAVSSAYWHRWTTCTESRLLSKFGMDLLCVCGSLFGPLVQFFVSRCSCVNVLLISCTTKTPLRIETVFKRLINWSVVASPEDTASVTRWTEILRGLPEARLPRGKRQDEVA